jgi:hypothetical protein
MPHLSYFAKAYALIVIAVLAAAVIAGLILVSVRKRPKKHSANERRFRNVFAMMTEDRRQSLISYYARKHECGREEAMQRAVEDRARDEGRW